MAAVRDFVPSPGAPETGETIAITGPWPRAGRGGGGCGGRLGAGAWGCPRGGWRVGGDRRRRGAASRQAGGDLRGDLGSEAADCRAVDAAPRVGAGTAGTSCSPGDPADAASLGIVDVQNVGNLCALPLARGDEIALQRVGGAGAFGVRVSLLSLPAVTSAWASSCETFAGAPTIGARSRLVERPNSLLVASLKMPALALSASAPTNRTKTTATVNAVAARRLSRQHTRVESRPTNTPSVGREAPFATAV